MTDRKMLEFAAKAAGLDAQWDCPERGMMMLTPNGVDTMTWNPLTNDGDALRLAVKCLLEIGFPAPRKVWSFGRKGDVCSEEYRSDPITATRRAITRAAAEIGRSMK